ncbi:MAG: hypothetical protein GXY05_10395 [Clostridiales bacterium]|nr:hypothetical protein [Clostridiales bacterium]
MINPNKMPPASATRVLNSTPLGQVLGERQIYRHLQQAGYRIAGDAEGKTVNLVKYAAWLADKKKEKRDKDEKGGKSQRSYEEIKEAARERSSVASKSGRDIGMIPNVVDKKRREDCKFDLKKFCETYFPSKFDRGWSPDHLLVIKKIETALLHGRLFALAMPRGSGKTTICETAALWAALYAHRKYILFIGATEPAATKSLAEIKNEIEINDLLFEDFPEVCFPVRKLDGIVNRSSGQTCCGERTKIKWKDGEIALPRTPKSVSSGIVIQSVGITGRIRGRKASLGDNTSVRPEFVLIDDPQTDESAASIVQNNKLLEILNKAILGLPGPGVKLSGVMPCTVIKPGDMADQILNREKHPRWNGERLKMILSFPKNMDIWMKFADILSESQRAGRERSDATEFYLANRQEMEDGAQVAWEGNFEPDEASALQHAMTKFLEDKAGFYAEYQNDPLPPDLGEAERIAEHHIYDRLNNRERYSVPLAADNLVMFIDVQKKVLFYTVCAFASDFTGWVIDYGTFPDQGRKTFSLDDSIKTYPDLFPGAGLEGAIYSALKELTDSFLSKAWKREDGVEMQIDRCLVDSGWGLSTDTVYRICKESLHSARMLPSKGIGITAAQKPMAEYQKRPGEKHGYNWYIVKSPRRRTGRYVLYDVNFWKTFYRERLFTAMGDKGSFSIWGSSPDMHFLFAQHLSSEFSVATSGRGRRVDIWELQPGRENHWLDCVVGCMVGASICGSKISKSAEAVAEAIKNKEIVTRVTPLPQRIVPLSTRITPRR